MSKVLSLNLQSKVKQVVFKIYSPRFMQTSLEQFRSLLLLAGQEISQINAIIEVTEDSWHLELDDASTMQIFFDSETGRIELYAELVKPVQEQELSVLQILLCLQYLQESSPRPRIAMDKPDGNLLCLLDLVDEDIETEKFVASLDYFCAYVINLCDFIRAYPQKSFSQISSTNLALQV